MVKIIGAILMIAGTSALGLRSVVRLRGRVRSLNMLVGALEIMQSEISDRMTPMPELFELLEKESAFPVSRLFENAGKGMKELGTCSFQKIWSDAVCSTPELMLEPNEELALCELGMSLGRYDVAQQEAAISYARKRVEEFAKKAERERARDSRMHAFLGVAAGLFAVIILI